MNDLWRAREIAELFQCPEFNTSLAGVSIDSRSISPGDLFIALSGDPGPRFGGTEPGARDGHDFIDMAVENGAAAVMAHRQVTTSVPVIRVGDTLDGLWQLAAAARARCTGGIVAVTGSSGKTTMRAWLEQLLEPAGKTHASIGSFNNHWGLPLSMARMPADTEFGVFEIGANHPGEIAPLSELASPDVAVVLNVLPAHIGNFPGMNALREEKLSISAGLTRDGVLVIPESLKSFNRYPQTLTFGLNGSADIGAEVKGAGQLKMTSGGQTVIINVPWHDPERLESVLAAVAILSALGVHPGQVAGVFPRLKLPEGRGNHHLVSGVTIIDDSYNANPASMAMAIRNLAAMPGDGRKIALLGEMLELGEETASAHELTATETAGLDRVISIGGGFSAIDFPTVHSHLNETGELDLNQFASDLEPGDTVLVKGSNKVFWKKGFVRALISAIERP